MGKEDKILRPSARASEEEWDEFLSNNILWAIDVSQYGINASASVITNKADKSLQVLVELNNCEGQYICLRAIIYNANKRIIGYGQLCFCKKTGFAVVNDYIYLNCSIAKIDRIIIGGEIE